MDKEQTIELLEHLAWDKDNEGNCYGEALQIAIDTLKQPEIITCGECARRRTMCDGKDRCTVFNVFVDSDGYCKWAERRTDD